QALGTTHVEGANLTEYELRGWEFVCLMWKLLRVIALMSWRGLSHNDIKLENVIVAPGIGEVWLVDFDQATSGHTRWRAFVRNLIGSAFYRNEVVVHASFRTLLRS